MGPPGLAPLLLPEVLTAIALLFFFYTVGIGTRGMVGLVVGHVLLTLPFVFMNVAASLESFDPDWDLAARSLGAGRITRFRRIMLPITPGPDKLMINLPSALAPSGMTSPFHSRTDTFRSSGSATDFNKSRIEFNWVSAEKKLAIPSTPFETNTWGARQSASALTPLS